MLAASRYSAFVFDFDGLLVNTDELLYLSWIDVLSSFKCSTLPSPFNKGLQHYLSVTRSNGGHSMLKKSLCAATETLDWERLRKLRSTAYQSRVTNSKGLCLKPGAEPLLTWLLSQEGHISRCVVTNSSNIETEKIREHIPILSKAIPQWFTRETWNGPKSTGFQQGFEYVVQNLKDKNRLSTNPVLALEDTPEGVAEICMTPAFQKGYIHALLITNGATYNELPSVANTAAVSSLCEISLP